MCLWKIYVFMKGELRKGISYSYIFFRFFLATSPETVKQRMESWKALVLLLLRFVLFHLEPIIES